MFLSRFSSDFFREKFFMKDKRGWQRDIQPDSAVMKFAPR